MLTMENGALTFGLGNVENGAWAFGLGNVDKGVLAFGLGNTGCLFVPITCLLIPCWTWFLSASSIWSWWATRSGSAPILANVHDITWHNNVRVSTTPDECLQHNLAMCNEKVPGEPITHMEPKSQMKLLHLLCCQQMEINMKKM